ncbi:MAG: hypothetical protein ACYDAQ_04015 [Mycobacteriales bacterium]
MGEWTDYYELTALASGDRNSSIQEVLLAVKQSGALEAVPDPEWCADPDDPDDPDGGESLLDRGGELAEIFGDDVAREGEERLAACATPPGVVYPFRVQAGYLEVAELAKPLPEPYTFMLLLSVFGLSAGPAGSRPERLFEAVSAHAAHRFLGGPDPSVHLIRFGFPRKDKSSFTAALDALCRDLNEGIGAVTGDRARQQKDGTVDLVVFRHFPDRRPGKIVAFGQCAAGKQWATKLTEMQPTNFIDKWIVGKVVSRPPLRMFFLPRRLSATEWDERAIDGGILFDRCRIATHCQDLDAATLQRCTDWSAHVLKTLVRLP